MSTLRDYILDCRCPNCGLLMQQRAPKKPPSKWAEVAVYARAVWSLLLLTVSGTHALAHEYGAACWYLLLLVAGLVTWDRRS